MTWQRTHAQHGGEIVSAHRFHPACGYVVPKFHILTPHVFPLREHGSANEAASKGSGSDTLGALAGNLGAQKKSKNPTRYLDAV